MRTSCPLTPLPTGQAAISRGLPSSSISLLLFKNLLFFIEVDFTHLWELLITWWFLHMYEIYVLTNLCLVFPVLTCPLWSETIQNLGGGYGNSFVSSILLWWGWLISLNNLSCFRCYPWSWKVGSVLWHFFCLLLEPLFLLLGCLVQLWNEDICLVIF